MRAGCGPWVEAPSIQALDELGDARTGILGILLEV